MSVQKSNKRSSHTGHAASPEATCHGKQPYDRATANLVARKTKKAILLTYQCPFCRHWHVGKNEKGK